jgi:hypothetical protein
VFCESSALWARLSDTGQEINLTGKFLFISALNARVNKNNSEINNKYRVAPPLGGEHHLLHYLPYKKSLISLFLDT